MMRSLYSGVSGLKAHQTKMDVIGNNIANVNTTGFKKVRAESKYENMPIIMVTTEGGKAEVITALKAGVNNYIVKPFTPQVLKEKLEDVLG